MQYPLIWILLCGFVALRAKMFSDLLSVIRLGHLSTSFSISANQRPSAVGIFISGGSL
jgi:hypothetical protein